MSDMLGGCPTTSPRRTNCTRLPAIECVFGDVERVAVRKLQGQRGLEKRRSETVRGERFHKTVLNEFYRMAYRTKVYRSLRCRPSRIVVDSLSEIRLLAQGSLRYRHQILALRHYFAGQGATGNLRMITARNGGA